MVKEDEKLIIEDGVTVLEPLSFVDCKAKEIIMPDSVETIKHCAFKNCDNLKKIVFGKVSRSLTAMHSMAAIR